MPDEQKVLVKKCKQCGEMYTIKGKKVHDIRRQTQEFCSHECYRKIYREGRRVNYVKPPPIEEKRKNKSLINVVNKWSNR